MPVKLTPCLTEFVKEKDSHTIDFYLSKGGYEAARKAVNEFEPAKLIQFVKDSNLRGRGGAGFPAGMKWSFVPQPKPGEPKKPKFLVLNADESEPGTFKDRLVMEYYPHPIFEGALIACWAVGIETVYIYIRGEMPQGYKRLVQGVNEAYDKGFFGKDLFGKKGFNVDCTIHRGGGAYICGEETSLLSSLEGNRGYPKLKPPFPAISGAFGLPTVVNNVVTVAYLPYIVKNGIDWWKSFGTPKSTGLMPYSLSGHVKKPGVYELPLNVTLKELINDFGGGWDKKLKAVIPGGSSSKVLRMPEDEDVMMDFDGLASRGSMLGSAAVIVMDETTCMVDALWNLLRFYHHESCGQCTPCREGSGWAEKILHRIEHGEGQPGDVDLLLSICDRAIGRTICVFAEAFGWPIQSYVAKFRDEFEQHIRERRCPLTGKGADHYAKHGPKKLAMAGGH